MAEQYAGDIGPDEAWEFLRDDKAAVMVDCRTKAEWIYVGVPDLTKLGKELICIEWVDFPAGNRNSKFVEEVKGAGITPDQKLLFLCRSGVRSKGAAIALTEAGYTAAYNVSEGFEGDKDEAGHRAKEGWKVRGLPWKQ